MKKNKVYKIIALFLLFVGIFIINFYAYILSNFSNVTFEELLYSLLYSSGTGGNSISHGIFSVIPSSLFFLCIIVYFINSKPKYVYNRYALNINNKKIKFFLFTGKRLLVFSSIVLFIAIVALLNGVNTFEFVKAQLQSSKFILDNFVDPRNVEIKFPEEKKNLLYIYVESLENSLLSKSVGGLQNSAYTPHLEQIAKDNLNFTNTDKIGGALSVYGTTWTAAAMVAQTGGVPIKLIIGDNDYTGYSKSFPGVYSVGEILKDNGYNNYIMMGSDGNFGGRKQYFAEHGNYEILDYYWAIDKGLIDKNYFEWWGFEDKKLFEFAKNELTEISSKGEPFNFTLLTADSHFTDGYVDKSCNNEFNYKYGNSFYCSDGMIYEFLEWAKTQSWYNDTVIIITGDHLSMQEDLVSDALYTRTVYNAFINVEEPENKIRTFTTLDMFPTTLGALGVSIKGNRLGLGANLFSNEPTLAEKYGVDYMNVELVKKSMYYNESILGNTYKEMVMGS